MSHRLSSMRQRQRQRSHQHPSLFQDRADPASALYIQAYEADIRRGRTVNDDERLMKWEGVRDGDKVDGDIWVDRHSILHLLPSIPSLAQPTSPTSSTGTGFTDLPSDAEDTFFFSGSEDEVSYEQYERAKKRRKVEMGREERLRAMEEGVRDGRVKGIDNEETEEKAEDGWISDEEPSETIHQLMTHTLTSLLQSPNPQILELRILTHHSNDARFAFLKGRYRRRWEGMKKEAGNKKDGREERDEEERKTRQGLVGMMGDYGSDESDEEEDAERDVARAYESPSSLPPPPPPPPPPEEDGVCAALPATDENERAGGDDQSAISIELQRDEVGEESRLRRREKARAWAASRGR